MRTAGHCAIAATALAFVGCAEPTQLIVVVRTDMDVPADVDQVRVRVFHIGDTAPTYDNTLPLPTSGTVVAGFQTLLSFGAGPHDDDATRRVQVLVDAVKGGRTLFTTEVRTGFARGKRLRLEVYLARRCLMPAVMCTPDQTCGLLGCVSPDVPVDALPPADSPPSMPPVDPRPAPPAAALPRLLRPLSLATATTQSPTLRFEPHPDADRHVRVLTQLRPTAVMPERFVVSASTRSFTPALPHPAGTYTWSIEAWQGTTMLSRSATWELFIPRYSAADLAWGTVPDVNGDGLGDLVVGDVQHLEVYLGGSDLTSATPAAVLHPVAGLGIGHKISSVAVGDVNGDGYGDVVVDVAPVLGGWLIVYFGDATGVTEARSRHVALPGDGSAASRIAMGGDVDGDGYGDVVVGAPNPPTGGGSVLVARGGPATLSVEGTWIFGTADPGFGSVVSMLGPVDVSERDQFVASPRRATSTGTDTTTS